MAPAHPSLGDTTSFRKAQGVGHTPSRAKLAMRRRKSARTRKHDALLDEPRSSAPLSNVCIADAVIGLLLPEAISDEE